MDGALARAFACLEQLEQGGAAPPDALAPAAVLRFLAFEAHRTIDGELAAQTQAQARLAALEQEKARIEHAVRSTTQQVQDYETQAVGANGQADLLAQYHIAAPESRAPSRADSRDASYEPRDDAASGEASREASAEPADREPSGGTSREPSGGPSREPSGEPTAEPSREPSQEPSGEPNGAPSGELSGAPSGEPRGEPSGEPPIAALIRAEAAARRRLFRQIAELRLRADELRAQREELAAFLYDSRRVHTWFNELISFARKIQREHQHTHDVLVTGLDEPDPVAARRAVRRDRGLPRPPRDDRDRRRRFPDERRDVRDVRDVREVRDVRDVRDSRPARQDTRQDAPAGQRTDARQDTRQDTRQDARTDERALPRRPEDSEPRWGARRDSRSDSRRVDRRDERLDARPPPADRSSAAVRREDGRHREDARPRGGSRPRPSRKRRRHD